MHDITLIIYLLIYVNANLLILHFINLINLPLMCGLINYAPISSPEFRNVETLVNWLDCGKVN